MRNSEDRPQSIVKQVALCCPYWHNREISVILVPSVTREYLHEWRAVEPIAGAYLRFDMFTSKSVKPSTGEYWIEFN